MTAAAAAAAAAAAVVAPVVAAVVADRRHGEVLLLQAGKVGVRVVVRLLIAGLRAPVVHRGKALGSIGVSRYRGHRHRPVGQRTKTLSAGANNVGCEHNDGEPSSTATVDR